jgi:hypothetical protein
MGVLIAVGLLGTDAAAQPLQGNLSLLPASSSLTAGGSVSGVAVTQQGAGSLTTTYSGFTGIASLDLTANQMTINSSVTNVVAAISGNWAPQSGGAAGTAPANYGGLLDGGLAGNIQFAIRNLTASVGNTTNGGDVTIPLTPTGVGTYSFPTNQRLTLTGTSLLDYRGSGLFAGNIGTESLTGENATNAGANGTLQDLGGGVFRLTYPVNLTINGDLNGQASTITLNGTLTAQGTLTPVPEPATVGLVGAAVLGAGALVRRKWRGE